LAKEKERETALVMVQVKELV
jgi:hypothetical protein